MQHFTICPPDPRIENPPEYEYAHEHLFMEEQAICPLCPLGKATWDAYVKEFGERLDARACESCRLGLPF